MNIDLASMSEKEKAEFAVGLRKMRNEQRVPDTLLLLSINSVIKNCDFYIRRHKLPFFVGADNPFQNLPDTVAHKILSVVAEIRKKPCNGKNGLFSCRMKENCFILQLLNESITEFDYFQAWNSTSEPIVVEEMFFRHLVEHCPNIKKIQLKVHLWENCKFLPRVCKEDLLMYMARWKNLSFLGLRDQNICLGHTEIKMIQENFPKLRGLEVRMDSTLLNVECVELFKKMEQLKYLHFIVKDKHLNANWPTYLAHITGRLPSLEEFGTEYDCHETFKKFVEKYGELYPGKKLALKCLWLKTDLAMPWPPCLTLEKLQIEQSLDKPQSLKKLVDTISCPVKIVHIKAASSHNIHHLIKKLGPDIVQLIIQLDSAAVKKSLDLNEVLAACPRIEIFEILSDGPYKKSTTRMKPQDFANYQEFKMRFVLDKGNADIWQMYKTYLLGSKKYLKSLECDDTSHIRVIFWALQQESCICLDRLQNIKLALVNEESELFEFIILLVQRCQLLQTIVVQSFRNYVYKLPKWIESFVKSVGIDITCTHEYVRHLDSSLESLVNVFNDDNDDESSYDDLSDEEEVQFG